MTFSVWGSFGTNTPTRDIFATETFAVLRTLTPPPVTLNASIEVDGGVTKGDGLGGIFYYDPASVLADDAVNTIAPTPLPAAGRWRRLLINVGFAVVTGGVVFGSGNVLTQDATKFFWDNVNKRLGIGNAIPSVELDVTGTIKASTSVVTPLVGTDTDTRLVFKIGGTNRWLFGNAADGYALTPNVDNTYDFGQAAVQGRTGYFKTSVITPIIDSGTTGSLSLKTNNGETIATFGRNGTTVNQWDFLGSATGAAIIVRPGGTDSNVNTDIRSKGTGSIDFRTDGTVAAPTQFQVLHTASSTRNITVTGSNGNPVINTSAGGLDISPTTARFPNIGTTAVAANATLNAVGSNDLLRSTSSQRYKKDWIDLEDADLDILDTIRTIKYKSLSEQDDPTLIHYGMLAEDVFKLNKNLVTFNTIDVGFDLDVPDWVQYERFIPLLIEQRRRDVKRIEALEAKLGIH